MFLGGAVLRWPGGMPFFHRHKKFPFPLPAGKLELTTAFSFEMEKRNKIWHQVLAPTGLPRSMSSRKDDENSRSQVVLWVPTLVMLGRLKEGKGSFYQRVYLENGMGFSPVARLFIRQMFISPALTNFWTLGSVQGRECKQKRPEPQ